MNSKQIRAIFLDFFNDKKHKIVSSAPVVVKNDPTLMFTNAGMNQFKDYFLGTQKAPFTRAADTQKCLRVSGKHNDLEEVGVDTYHHTLFEMLGNWSFGDYFKQDAIAWAWELLVDVYQIPKDRLYVTVFEGDASEQLPFDQESYDEWKKHISEDRILKGNKKDNFWEMGETGPCGPCSEIHVDIRSDEERIKTDGKTLVNASHPQVIEIWNNVFMEFNRKADGCLEKLPQQHVDTGMGFERLCMVLQGKQSNYDTDVFQNTISFISEKSGIKYGVNEKTDIAMRVMSDHIRAIVFTIADGQLPSNNKAGYVIRRILRRAVRYAYTFLKFKQPFLYKMVNILADQFADTFPEVSQQKEFIAKVIYEEESSFLRTLETGLRKFDSFKGNSISGKDAFELYDTYGFPIDLTQLMAREKNMQIDMNEF
ncbi:MAG TPA: alanine--tRNA ligase, partial [Bacteroidia bacterium]|nr:alanine--tRNA ligase [Bacteroidia bacterium]